MGPVLALPGRALPYEPINVDGWSGAPYSPAAWAELTMRERVLVAEVAQQAADYEEED